MSPFIVRSIYSALDEVSQTARATPKSFMLV